jgi:Type 9 secretion system plug protein 1st domain
MGRTVLNILIFCLLSPAGMLVRIYNPCQQKTDRFVFQTGTDEKIETLSVEDPLSCSDNIFDQRIKTVQLYKEGWNFSYPIINLNGKDTLLLQFDLIDNKTETYYYTFIHCNKDWNKSDIFISDYLEGFTDNPINDVKPSFNTTVKYFHYTLRFPNENISFLLSGNYIIVVYPDGEPDKPVLTQRFIITEDRVKTDFRAYRPLITAYNNTGQQFDFTVDLNGTPVIDPLNNIYCFVLQNGRWNNAKKNLRPDFTGNNELKYNAMSEKNIFIAGNEFRYFDIKSIKYQSEFVRKIDYVAPYYNVYLAPSDNREFKPYFYWQDFNGKYYIATDQGKDPETDADYAYVYFTLPSKYMIAGGNMYVSGALNDWNFNENNLMTFNPQQGQYECTMLLKQGWYNYEYVFLRKGDTEGVASVFEGSHYETENDYLVLVYYRNPQERYDRVIGTAATNTNNRLSY